MTDEDLEANKGPVDLPLTANQVALEHSELWEAYKHMGAAASAAGPLDNRAKRLVHLAMAIAAGSEGATHSHARRAIQEGWPERNWSMSRCWRSQRSVGLKP